jgi:nuclear pore complex protein Nup98-Nup96
MSDRIEGSGMEGLEERVAFKEMSRAVTGWITHEDVQVRCFSLSNLDCLIPD